MKQLATVFTITTLTAFAPAMAEMNTVSVSTPVVTEVNTNISAPTDVELAFAVGGNQNLQAVVMTDEQMAETEGAWVTTTAIGAGIGGAGYAYGVYKGDYKWNTGKFIGNVASGAIVGTLTGGAGYIASGGAKLVPSLTNAGANIWRANGLSVNYGINKAWRR